MITLETELSRIRGLSAAFIEKLKKLDIVTVRDILWHFPFRYDDFSRTAKIADLAAGQTVTVSAVVERVSTRRTQRRHMTLVEAVIADETGNIRVVWFNQPFVARTVRMGVHANFAGKVVLDRASNDLYFANPSYEFSHGELEARHTGGFIPIYPETKGLTSRGIRYLVRPILHVLPPPEDFVPEHIRKTRHFPSLAEALKQIHFPKTIGEAERARQRFAFDHLFLLQLGNMKLRYRLSRESAPTLKSTPADIKRILSALPFKLTATQQRSLDEVLADLKKNHPMNRLLQGDVGSGKTVIAAVAALIAARNGKQAAFMAPTEVLARQHLETFKHTFGALAEQWEIKIVFLAGSLPLAEKRRIVEHIVGGGAHIVIGTHALIQKHVLFHDIGLIIVDEQHRFGVAQRAELSARAERSAPLPHFLSMSATPIPRTLSLTIYGDLDVSTIEELPQGRKPVVTKVVSAAKREMAYAFVRGELGKGRQVFVVCPRIEGATAGDNKKQENVVKSTAQRRLFTIQAEVRAVTEEYKKLSGKVFPDFRVAMLHGKLKGSEKERIMNEFRNGMVNVLVSTSVIEVGVDVPNANVMVIEGAERFGLAQLYQFRGRIGRGSHRSYCLLFTESKSRIAEERLSALLKAKNGFELAELDLKIRGPGEFIGERQTGAPDVAMHALADVNLIRSARQAASEIVQKDPELLEYPLLRKRFSQFRVGVHLE